MKAKLVLVAAALALVALALSLESARTLARLPPPTETGRRPAMARVPLATSPTPWPLPDRDPFRFLEPATAPIRVLTPPSPRDPTLAVYEALPGQPRLVGFVRRSGSLKAALAVNGDVSLASVGDLVDGWSILAIDEDTGVRARDRAGVEHVLTMSPDP